MISTIIIIININIIDIDRIYLKSGEKKHTNYGNKKTIKLLE